MSNSDEIKKSFYSLFSQSRDEKGGLNNHQKKGSEIKLGLTSLHSTITNKKSSLLDKIVELSSKISFQPDENVYYNEDYKHLIDYKPKRFSYDMIRSGVKEKNIDSGISIQVQRVPTEEEKNLMREYNRCCSEYSELCVDKIKIEALKRNVQENKLYTLSTNQLAILGI